jgi:hypothetical protein
MSCPEQAVDNFRRAFIHGNRSPCAFQFADDFPPSSTFSDPVSEDRIDLADRPHLFDESRTLSFSYSLENRFIQQTFEER